MHTKTRKPSSTQQRNTEAWENVSQGLRFVKK